MIKIEKCEVCETEIQIKGYDTIKRYCSDKYRKVRHNK